jgi:TRAP-type mannitol/chloroaromatic compound transport system substrate-binding protein
MSGGRLDVTVYPANTLARAFETFDAVSAEAADMYHPADNYFGSKSPASDLYSAVPYGMTAYELNAGSASAAARRSMTKSTRFQYSRCSA